MTEACAHHWVYERPDGPTSKGVCKVCGIEAEHWNTLDHGGAGYGWLSQSQRMDRTALRSAIEATETLARERGGRVAWGDATKNLVERGIYKSEGSAKRAAGTLLDDSKTWISLGRGEYQIRKAIN